MLHLRLVLAFALLYSFTVVTHGRAILDPIGGPAQTASAVSGDKGLGVDPNG
jgi:hypothetical protein